MDPNYAGEKTGSQHPPAYQVDMGYPPARGVAPSPGQGYSAIPYGAQPYGAQLYPGQTQYPGQAGITNQATVFVTTTHVEPVPDYTFYSIFTLLCCCWPLGLVALIYAINAKDVNIAGNRDLALQKSRTSLILNNVAVGIGLGFIVIAIIFAIIINFV